ncbi:phospholipase-like protein [Tanacetum coccineum]|uniref:Phospholipase-like protein n=1 Tax=Tanacetum coccineum TaxID=301880 RepID=A0ABQ4ZRZ0_9ASTR
MSLTLFTLLFIFTATTTRTTTSHENLTPTLKSKTSRLYTYQKVNELGINERVKVSTAVSLGNVSLGSFKVVCGGFVLKRDLSNDVSYVGLDAGEMMDYGVVDVRVSKAAEDMGFPISVSLHDLCITECNANGRIMLNISNDSKFLDIGRQIDDENDDDENVPLNYSINNELSIQFGREEFCLVTGLRFGVENWEEYDTQENLPFRRRVFPSHLDGQHITGIDIVDAIEGPTFAELYDNDVVGLCCLGILQVVLLGAENRRNVPEWLLRIANDRVAWNKYPWGSYVWPTLYSQLRNATVRRWGPLYVDQPTNEDDRTTYSIFGYTWAFKTWILESFRVNATRYFDRFNRYPRVAAWRKKKGRFTAEMVFPFFQGNIPVARLTPDDIEARSDWWISSKAYFDGFIDQVERVPFDLSRQNLYEIPSGIYRQFVEQKIELERNKKDVDDIKEEMQKFREEMNARPVRQENTVPIIVGQHYGLSDFSEFRSMQGGPSSFMNMGTPPKFQTPMRSQPGSSDWQRQMPEQSASHYWQPSPHPGSYNSFAGVPSHMGRPNLQTTIDTQHDVDGIVDQPANAMLHLALPALQVAEQQKESYGACLFLHHHWFLWESSSPEFPDSLIDLEIKLQ